MKKIVNYRPILLFAFALAAGITCAWLFCTGRYLLASLLTTTAVIFLIVFALFFKKKEASRIVIAAGAFIIGLSVMFVQAATITNRKVYSVETALTGTVTDNYKVTGENYKYYDMLLRDCTAVIDGKTVVLSGTVRADGVGTKQNFEPGDILYFSCTLTDIQLLKPQAETANYRTQTYWSVQNISGEITQIKGKPKADESIRLYIRNTFDLLLSETNAGTATALVLGDKSGIDKEVNEAFRITGVAHIFAVSGLHVGFIVLVVNFLLKKFKVNKYAALLLTLALMLVYAWVCGFPSSVLRAVLMTGALMLAKAAGRQPDILSSLGFAACVILLVRPLYIVDLGFLLSVSAIFGIACLTSVIMRLTSKIKSAFLKKCANGLAVCLGASAGTFPLVVLAYGEFSLIGLLFNVIAIPVVTVVFIGLLLMLVPPFFSLAVPVNAAIALLTSVAAKLSTLPFAAVGVNSLSYGMPFYFALLFLFGRFVLLKKKDRLKMAAVLAAAVFVASLMSLIPPSPKNEIEFLDSGSNGSFVVKSELGGHMIFNNLESYLDFVRINGYCQKYRLKEVTLYMTDTGKTSLYWAEKLSQTVNIKTVYILGAPDIFGKTYAGLTQISNAVVNLDYDIHSHAVPFETTSVSGTLTSVRIELGGKTVVYFTNAPNADITVQKYPNADIVITNTHIQTVWSFYRQAQKISFSYFNDRCVLFPCEGRFTLRVANDKIVMVR